MNAGPDKHHSIRYIAVALLSAAIGNAIMIGGDAAGIAYPVLVIVSWTVTGTLAYALHAVFTFQAGIALGSWLRFMAGNAMSVPAWNGWRRAVWVPASTVAPMVMPSAVSVTPPVQTTRASARMVRS